VSHTSGSIPSVARIAIARRRTSAADMDSPSGANASSIQAIARPRRSGSASSGGGGDSSDRRRAIYVLEGELLVDIDGEQHRVGQSGFFFAPRGVPHAFMVTSETARVLALQTPGTGEAFYREAGEPIRSAEDASRPADFSRLREVAERSESIELLGPPPFEAAQRENAPASSH